MDSKVKTVLITGATGFIGYFLVKEFIKDYNVICIVRPNSRNLIRLEEFKNKITLIEHNLKDSYDSIFNKLKNVNLILHAGGNPSSEDSVNNPVPLITDNILGTLQVLELSRKLSLDRFFYYAAGESFGPVLKNQDSLETDPYNSLSPYAAAKAGGEELCTAYSYTYNIPMSITHIANTFGPMSQSNRFPVIAIKKIINDEELVIHVDSSKNIGGRRWLYAGDVALHTRFILDNQKSFCEKWNSAGSTFITNLDFAKLIASILNKELNYKLKPSERYGHHPYFSNDPIKLYNAGWVEPINMKGRLEETVNWYKNNSHWLSRA